jgi:hypothetical protein
MKTVADVIETAKAAGAWPHQWPEVGKDDPHGRRAVRVFELVDAGKRDEALDLLKRLPEAACRLSELANKLHERVDPLRPAVVARREHARRYNEEQSARAISEPDTAAAAAPAADTPAQEPRPQRACPGCRIPIPIGAPNCPQCGLQIGPNGYPAEPIYLDFLLQFETRGFPTPDDRRAFYPEIQELACRCFGFPAFTEDARDRLTTWLGVEFTAAKDVKGIPLREVEARLGAELSRRTGCNPPAVSRPPQAGTAEQQTLAKLKAPDKTGDGWQSCPDLGASPAGDPADRDGLLEQIPGAVETAANERRAELFPRTLEIAAQALRREAEAKENARAARAELELARLGAAGQTATTPNPPADPVTLGKAVLIHYHQRGDKLTVVQLAAKIGVKRSALYENKEFGPLRKLAHDLFPQMFGKEAKKGDRRGPRGTKDREGNVDAEDVDAEPIEDKAVD